MSLLNLPPADGSSSGGGTDTLDDLADRLAKRKKKKQEDDAARDQQKQQQTTTTTKQEEKPKPTERSLPDRIASGIADIFRGNTDADKERRKKSGQAIEYSDQQVNQKKTATEFKGKNQPSADRGVQLSFTSGDLDARRDFFKKSGVDIDQAVADKKTYEDFVAKNKGKSLAKLTLAGKVPEAAKRWESNKANLEKAERSYQRNLKSQSGADSVLEQAERNFIRGAAEPIASTVPDLHTAAGAVIQAVAPAGSRVQKAGDAVYQGGVDKRDELANRIATSGYAPSANDSQFVSGVASGAGSLLASVGAAKALKTVTAPAAIFGLEAGADQTVAAKKAGKGDISAAFIGAGAGLVEGGLESIGLEKFLGATGGPVKEAITRMLTEGTQEALQSLGQAGATATYSKVDIGQAITQAVQEAGLGALVGGGASLPMTISQQLQAQGVDHKDAARVAVDVQQRIKTVLEEEKGIVDATASQPAPEAATQATGLLNLPAAEGAADGELLGAEDVEKYDPETFDKPYEERRKNIPPEVTDQITGHIRAAAEATATGSAEGAATQDAKARQLAIKHGLNAATDFHPATVNQKPAEGQSGVQGGEYKGAPSSNVGKITTVADEPGRASKPAALASSPIKDQPIPKVRASAIVGSNGNTLVQNIAKARKRFGEGEAEKIGTEYNSGLNQPVFEFQDLRTDKDREGLEVIGDVVDPGKTGKPQLVVYTVDHTEGTLKRKAGRVAQTKAKLAALDDAPTPAPATTAVTRKQDKARGAKPKTVATSDKKGTSQNKKTESEHRNSREDAHLALDDYMEVPAGRESMRSAEELTRLADKLNKAGQSGAIQRRGGLRGKGKLGVHKHGGRQQEGEPAAYLALQDAVIQDPRMYAAVLAHEMSHAIEYRINGNTKNTLGLFGDLTKAERSQISAELKEIVNALEGEAVAKKKPGYYYKPTEMLARYVETLVLDPPRAEALAPLLTEKFEDLAVREPLVADLVAALEDSLDKGFKNFTHKWVKDMRQLYRKKLGKRAGDIAYDAEVIRRAEINRSQSLIGKLVKSKFKGIKDKPEQLFRAAEAILVTKDGEPQFGTHDFMWGQRADDIKKLATAGWRIVEKHEIGTKEVKGATVSVYEYDLARARYTPEQAQRIFNELSPAGQQLIKDFTAAKEEAKDEFNRELMKELYGIDSKIEGWVHHFFEGKPFSGGNSTSLKTKVAAAKKQRTGAEGYVEDFQKAVTKALLELDSTRINNGFIADQLARISKPIAKGDKPEQGWVEVVADGKGGLRLPGEGMQILVKPDEGKAVKIPQRRYQVPEDLAKHYREMRDVPTEVDKVARAINHLAKYWTLNVLIHPGSTATNFISGGFQYGGKIVNDFYLDLLTANFSMDRTRSNLIAPIKVLTPRGWTNAPDWLYGGYRTNQAGQFTTGDDTKIDKGLNEYGDKMLYVFGLVETYWKKVIALSEGSQLSGASNRRITDRLHAEEQQIIAEVNKAIDTYAFDYDNKPLWLSKFDRNGGKLFKPFMTYPYKLVKFYTHFAASGFDRTLPWQVRVSKVMTLATIVAAIAMLYDDREDKTTVPKGTEETPLALTPGGRVFLGRDKNGDELFIRTAKYPFFNLTSGANAIAQRNGEELNQLLNEQLGTLGPAAELFLLGTGRKDQFSQYTSTSAILGEQVGSFIPGFRVLSDAGRLIDDNARAPENFVQGMATNLPIWGSEEQRAKLRGKVRTIKIPDETKEGRSINKNERTVTERAITNNDSDVLLGALTGIYRRRIDPKEAEAQHLREIRDDADFEIRQMLLKGNEADAAAMGEQYGLQIPDATYKYYRRLGDDKRKEQIENAKKKKAKEK
jgi:hypothetical protein